MINDVLKQIIADICYIGITTLFGISTYYIKKFINSKQELIEEQKEALKKQLGDAQYNKDVEIAQRIVMAVEQMGKEYNGAGWVYFGKDKSKVEVINDIDKELVNLFKMIKYHAEEVRRLLAYEVSSRDIFSEYKDIDAKLLTEIQRAVRFIYLLSQSFASKGDHFGYGTTGIPKPQIFNTEDLIMLKERFRNTYIENLSFEKILKKYDREHTFFFCDPPYFETCGYKNQFNEEDHIKLRDMLSNIRGKFLLTINDNNKVREWYKDFNISETEVSYLVCKEEKGRRKFKELIITNY